MSVLRNKEILRVKTKRRMSQIEASGNLALALNAMKQDGVKLVNIGSLNKNKSNYNVIYILINW